VLIAHLDANDVHHGRAGILLEAAALMPLRASTITLAEVLAGPARSGRIEQARKALRTLDVRELTLEEGSAPRLAALRAETGLKLPDCCMLLAGLESGAQGIVSFDDRLVAAAAQRGLAWSER